MSFDKQEKIAQETLEIYCPLASRLGIAAWKIELEDLCFRYYRPDVYYQMIQKVKKTEVEHNRYIDEVKKLVAESLGLTSIKYKVYGRSKHLWSIYRKMQSRKYPLLYRSTTFLPSE